MKREWKEIANKWKQATDSDDSYRLIVEIPVPGTVSGQEVMSHHLNQFFIAIANTASLDADIIKGGAINLRRRDIREQRQARRSIANRSMINQPDR